MKCTLLPVSDRTTYRIHVVILAFSWILGWIVGFLFAYCWHDIPDSMMLEALQSPMSIVGTGTVIVLPFVLSAVASHFRLLWFLYPLAALKGVCLSFCICMIQRCYGSAAWLVTVLFLFSDLCLLVPLLLFWIRCPDRTVHSARSFCGPLTLSTIVLAVHRFAISPFLQMLLQ